MAAVKPGDVDRLLRAPPPQVVVFLVYGSDLGRVAERVRTLLGPENGSDPDPFRIVKLSGEDVADNPGRLLDEAQSYGLFGSRRAIWIRPTSRDIAPALSACLEASIRDTAIVVEAGDLPKSSPLRLLCEKAPSALALPCYADEARDLGAVLDEFLGAEGLSIDRDAREALLECLGGDRLATRSELAKLAFYVRGRSRIGVEDIEASVSDVSGLRLDDAVDAAFAGDVAECDGRTSQLIQQGTTPAAILSAATRHALTLLGARQALGEGQPTDDILRNWKGLHFRRRPSVQRQLRRWNVTALTRLVGSLQADTLLSRQASAFAPVLAARVLFQIATAGRGLESEDERRRQASSSS